MKKTYIQPLMKACELDPSAMICGSNDDEGNVQSLNLGEGPLEGENGIIQCESKGQGAFGELW